MAVTEVPATADEGSSPRPARWWGAVAGLVAGALALGAAELVAGALGRAGSPAVAVGRAAIDRTPRPLKEFAIRTFGESDKLVLLAGVLATIALLAATLGVLGTRRPRAGVAGVAALGLVAAAAAATRPDAVRYDVLPSLTAAAAGSAALVALLRAATPGAAVAPGPLVPGQRPPAGGEPEPARGPGRRPLLLAGSGAAVAAASGVGGRFLLRARTDVEASRRALVLPRPGDPAPPLPAGATLDTPGISPFFTANREFYRVDTALSVPRLVAADWRLRVHGMVDRELDLSFDDLLARPVVERDITLTCVSNEVGGNLLGTARWLGTGLGDLLREAGVRPGATQLVSRSVDGMTIGTPVAAVVDGRDALLAYGMNGEPLLPEHGFPVRMVVPGLYGYVSATKWVVDLELTTFEAFDAYWVERGWAEQAEIRTSSRIDVPQPLSTVAPGRVAVAGVAWAQHRGIGGVDVRVDEGEWQEATLSAPAGVDLWRQWVWEWDAAPGSHMLQVRATDATGRLQEERRQPPFPSGSTGWQSVLVTVAG
jgi:DMSO/TMAO reductase YedYZ molybdopterin-dependent catalytic subunit